MATTRDWEVSAIGKGGEIVKRIVPAANRKDALDGFRIRMRWGVKRMQDKVVRCVPIYVRLSQEPKLVSAVATNVRNALAVARRVLGVTLREAPVTTRSDHGNGLYRVTLGTGDTVEVTVKAKTQASAEVLQ